MNKQTALTNIGTVLDDLIKEEKLSVAQNALRIMQRAMLNLKHNYKMENCVPTEKLVEWMEIDIAEFKKAYID
jgi:hypothetical protein